MKTVNWLDISDTVKRCNLVILDGKTIKDRWHVEERGFNDTRPADRFKIERDYPEMGLLILKSIKA